MSKKKAGKLFKVKTLSGDDFYVLARHCKGAKSVAREHLDREDISRDAVFEEFPEHTKDMARRAINHKAEG